MTSSQAENNSQKTPYQESGQNILPFNDNIAIKVENLTKIYKLYDKPVDRLKESLHPFKKKYHREFYALKNLNFEVKEGETVGIIGKNGAGKSTLLQIITGVVTPTSGNVIANGKIAALLELGTGFNPELTGIENIYFSGTIMGYTKEEIDAKLDDIISFADIGDFINQPIKLYSSGMMLRLAFSVAINVDPKILIIDEALAVGDMGFQMKCINRIDRMRSQGITMLFVSHAPTTIKKLCDRAIWISDGQIYSMGEAVSIADAYNDFIDQKASCLMDKEIVKEDMKVISDNQGKVAIIKDVEILNENYKPVSILKSGDNFHVKIDIECKEDLKEVVLGCAIFDAKYFYISGLNTALDNIFLNCSKGTHTYYVVFKDISLSSGTYYIDIGLFEKNAFIRYDYKSMASKFFVEAPYLNEGLLVYPHEWIIDKNI